MNDETPTTWAVFEWLSEIATPADVARVQRWAAELERSTAEKAWDAGWERGWGHPHIAPIKGNPYRKETP